MESVLFSPRCTALMDEMICLCWWNVPCQPEQPDQKRVHFHKLQQKETRWGFFPHGKPEFRVHYESRRSWSPGLRALLGPAAVLWDVWVWTYNHRVSSSKTLQLPEFIIFFHNVNIWLIECERGSERRCENTRAGKGGFRERLPAQKSRFCLISFLNGHLLIK